MYHMNIKYITTYLPGSPTPTSCFLLPWTEYFGLFDLKINSERANILTRFRIPWTANFLNAVPLGSQGNNGNSKMVYL